MSPYLLAKTKAYHAALARESDECCTKYAENPIFSSQNYGKMSRNEYTLIMLIYNETERPLGEVGSWLCLNHPILFSFYNKD